MPTQPIDFAFLDPLRRRKLAEQALGLPAIIPFNLNASNSPAPRAVTLPDLPTAPRPLPPASASIPGGNAPSRMPGAPSPSSLPELVTPRPTRAPAGPPGGAMTMPPLPPELAGAATVPQSRYGQIQTAKDAYLAGTPGRFKSAAINALRGAVAGLATGQGLGAGLGGAIAGGAYGAIDPRGARAAQFEREVRPRIEERFAYEDLEAAARRAAEKALLDDMTTRAQLANINSQINSRAAQTALNQSKFDWEREKPDIVQPGATVYDHRTKQPVFTAPTTPKPPTAAELMTDPETGMSVEEMADASYNARGGDRYVYDRLPERTRRVLESEPGMVDPAEVAAANRMYQEAINRQRRADLDFTRGHIRSKRLAAGRRQDAVSPELPQPARQHSNVEQTAPAASASSAPRGAQDAIAELERLRAKAQQAWSEWRDPKDEKYRNRDRDRAWVPEALDMALNAYNEWSEPEAQKREPLRRAAEEAQRAYNQAVEEFGRQYGQWYETGQGDQGWNYYKPKSASSSGRPARGRTAISVQEAATLLQ